jgi:SAM-dependent methyltransferase
MAQNDEIPERFDPETMQGLMLEAEHLARYAWACGFVEGRTVLDIACGVGYGCEMMRAAGASEVIGVDVDLETVERASANAGPGLSFARADASRLPFADGRFDVATCFEMIEHVQNQSSVLAEARRVLRQDGVLLVSTPNRENHPQGNPHHVRELDAVEFEGLLSTGFPHHAMIEQTLLCASLVSARGDGGHGDLEAVPTRLLLAPGVRGASPHYFIAVAGRHAEAVGRALERHEELVAATGIVEVARLADAIRRQDAALRRDEATRRRLPLLERRLREVERDLAATADRLAGREAEVADLTRELEAARAASTTLDERARIAERQLHMLATSRTWRLTEPLRLAGSAARQRLGGR